MSASGTKVFRDAVHGDISLPRGPLLEVLDTSEVQRLRGIKQLGTAYLVYPSAVHTRFEHSLGTCHLALRIWDGLGGDPASRQVVAAAALLHDVTHIPFGHTLEDERRIFERHDGAERTRLFLRRGGLGRVLRRSGLTRDVEAVLVGEGNPPLASDVVRGAIGADLLDYLARDAYFSGLGVRYDERIFRYFIEDGGRLALDAQKEGIVRADAISEVIHLLRIRYFLSERVYYHHAKVASGAMISRAVELAVARGLRLEDLYELKDEGLFQVLRDRYADEPVLVDLVRRVEARRLHKRAYVLTRDVGEAKQRDLVARYHEDLASRERAEADLERSAGLAPGQVIVYCPAASMALKEARVPVRVDRGPARPLEGLHVREVEVLHERHRDLWRFYVFLASEARGRARRLSGACEDYFGERNRRHDLEGLQGYLGF
ncbi:MAG: HD domain-containing protein [Planctomycetes bacterium]|nr:HD domain-containing protein [Planctomycetota bacterium]